jgi:hypothetical protein
LAKAVRDAVPPALAGTEISESGGVAQFGRKVGEDDLATKKTDAAL